MTIAIQPFIYLNYPTDASVEISYEASVNENAVHENTNSVSMTWTEFDPGTDPSDPDNPPTETEDAPQLAETSTYVYGFDLKKYKEEAGPANILEGAEFKLYDQANDCNEIKLVETTSGHYRPALPTEVDVNISAGTAEIFGLATGTYWLEETRAPDGYNQLASRVKVEIKDENCDEGYLIESIDVINKAGISLPETGGIGSFIFYFCGSALMLAALIIFFKKAKPALTKKTD